MSNELELEKEVLYKSFKVNRHDNELIYDLLNRNEYDVFEYKENLYVIKYFLGDVFLETEDEIRVYNLNFDDYGAIILDKIELIEDIKDFSMNAKPVEYFEEYDYLSGFYQNGYRLLTLAQFYVRASQSYNGELNGLIKRYLKMYIVDRLTNYKYHEGKKSYLYSYYECWRKKFTSANSACRDKFYYSIKEDIYTFVKEGDETKAVVEVQIKYDKKTPQDISKLESLEEMLDFACGLNNNNIIPNKSYEHLYNYQEIRRLIWEFLEESYELEKMGAYSISFYQEMVDVIIINECFSTKYKNIIDLPYYSKTLFNEVLLEFNKKLKEEAKKEEGVK